MPRVRQHKARASKKWSGKIGVASPEVASPCPCAWYVQGPKQQECVRTNILTICSPRSGFRAAGDHPVTLRISSRGRALEHERRALASAIQYTRPSRACNCRAAHPPHGPQLLAWADPQATHHACMEALASDGWLRCNSGQGGRTGAFFGCVLLDTTAKLHYHCDYSAFLPVQAVKRFWHSN